MESFERARLDSYFHKIAARFRAEEPPSALFVTHLLPERPRLRGGNAVNFLHGASVGPFIFLVQAEILAALHMLTRGNLTTGTHDVPAAGRAVIADAWLTAFYR